MKKAYAAVVAFEKAHGRKLAATAVYLLTHPAQVHTAGASVYAAVVQLLSGVAS